MPNKQIIQTDAAPTAVGTYSQGVECHNMIFFSGQIGIDPQSGELQESFEAQMKQILKNIDALLEESSITRCNIIKTSIFLTDMANFKKVNLAYDSYFATPYPARSCVEVSALPKGALVEIEVIAAR